MKTYCLYSLVSICSLNFFKTYLCSSLLHKRSIRMNFALILFFFFFFINLLRIFDFLFLDAYFFLDPNLVMNINIIKIEILIYCFFEFDFSHYIQFLDFPYLNISLFFVFKKVKVLIEIEIVAIRFNLIQFNLSFF